VFFIIIFSFVGFKKTILFYRIIVINYKLSRDLGACNRWIKEGYRSRCREKEIEKMEGTEEWDHASEMKLIGRQKNTLIM